MLTAMALSVLFLVSYILHHLFAGETRFGGEGAIKVVYYLILATHIILAATSLALHPAHRLSCVDGPVSATIARWRVGYGRCGSTSASQVCWCICSSARITEADVGLVDDIAPIRR